MTEIPDRRSDRLLRETIVEYRRMSKGAQNDAASCKDPVVKERFIALAKSLTELADSLQGRSSNETTTQRAVGAGPKQR